MDDEDRGFGTKILLLFLLGIFVAMFLSSGKTSDTNDINVKISNYWPPLGGVNCAKYTNGECVSTMANGETWQSCKDKNCLACPTDFNFGATFVISETEWVCTDRGSKITKVNDNTYWVDLLVETPIVPYGTVISATVK